MSEARAAFAHRLNQAFDRLGVPAKQHGRFTALARLFGVSAVAARDWCEGKSYPSVDKLLVILDTVRCGADWLLYGRQAPDAPLSGPCADGAMRASSGGAAPAGSPTAAPKPHADLADEPGWWAVEGDSMSPALQPGDRVRLAPAEPGALRDGIYLLHASARPGAPRLRRMQSRMDGTLEVACDNPLYAERGRYLPGTDGRLAGCEPGMPEVQVVGRVVEVRRRLP